MTPQTVPTIRTRVLVKTETHQSGSRECAKSSHAEQAVASEARGKRGGGAAQDSLSMHYVVYWNMALDACWDKFSACFVVLSSSSDNVAVLFVCLARAVFSCLIMFLFCCMEVSLFCI